MDVKFIIERRVNQIKERYNKLLPAFQNKSLEEWLLYQPLRNVNPNDPNDPIPFRTDPDAKFTPYELTLLAEQIQNAHKSLRQPQTSKVKPRKHLDIVEAIASTKMAQDMLPWMEYVQRNLKIGTCTARRKLDTGTNRPIKRGEKGVIISPKATDLIQHQPLREKIYSLSHRKMLTIIFNDTVLFVTEDNLNKVVYDKQMCFI